MRYPLVLALLLAAGSSAANAAGDVLPAGATNRPPFELKGEPLRRLQRALEPYHKKYDAEARMLKEPFHSPGYHTTLKGGFVHSTRSSLNYAVALLDTGDEPLRQRAEAILNRVISLQDQNPDSKTYGIWSWFLEEPLDKMSPPDWNWADFCGVQLLQAALDHRRRLSPETVRAIDGAIQHAARSIKKRNVGPGYTNIAIMGAYVTLVAGELYDWAEMREYGLARWRQFYEHTRKHGAFNEYNSPTYTIVALEELGRMRQHVQNPEARRLTEEIYRLAWEEIASHFHPPTRQWAGPHSRAYSTLLGAGVLALIQRATDGRVAFGVDVPSLTEGRLPLPCPPQFERSFLQLDGPREVRKQFIAAEPPVIGTTWLQPEFALGTVNRGDLWNQRRALVAYWGDAKQPSYLHLRCLHDGYDFAAAQFFSVQQKGRALAAINFATDGGDTHVSLDRLKDGVVRAKDIRLRLELGGAAGRTAPAAPERLTNPAQWRSGAVTWQIQALHAGFGPERARWESGQQGEKAWLDLVLYSGESKIIRLAELGAAAAGLALEVSPESPPPPSARATLRDGQLALEWETLRLAIPVTPAKAGQLQKTWRSAR